MMRQFLREVARVYTENHGADLKNFIFVFPNRRSQRFFIKFLGEEYGKVYDKPLISPQMVTVNELFTELSGIKKGDSIELLYILYQEYAKLKQVKCESFDEFANWGEVIIKDFDDIDKYFINAKQLFANIKDLKELDSDFSFLTPAQKSTIETFWKNFLKGEFSSKKEFFISLWDIMHPLYTAYNETLLNKKIGYEGMIYKAVANSCEKRIFNHNYIFIGFNAPNMCERELFNHLVKIDKADFYWDFYGDILTDKDNSAGNIIKECVKTYPSKYKLEFDTITHPNINVIGVPSSVGQAFATRNVLKQLSGKAIDTAIILPKEELLLPVINSIPDEYDSVNVTMGYPIATSSFISFMNMICSLQTDTKEQDGKFQFYHKHILAILSHDYLKRGAGEESTRVREKIIKENRIFIEQTDAILEQSNPLFESIFKVVDTPDKIAEYQIEILKQIELVADTLEKEFIYQYYQQINRLKSLEIPMERRTYFKFISKITAGISVPFRGEPLRGLQIMGALEVRALDFENIIYLSVNEGVFPSTSQSDSLIPYNLRLGFGLPTYEMRDGMAAYHFYRSISRAKNVYLIYNSVTDGLNTGEASRYVKQLKYHFNIPIKESVVASSPSNNTIQNISVEKSAQVMAKLEEKYISGEKSSLSASALNNYMICPLKFYVENVCGVRDEDDVVESVEANTFGNIYHHAMQSLYNKYRFELIGEEIIKREIKDVKGIEKYIRNSFANEFKTDLITGQNIIIMELLKKYVNLTLKEDLKFAPFIYLSSEERYHYQLLINEGKRSVNFKAFIDRIDILDKGTLRIIDYKTGTVEKPTQSFVVSDLFNKQIGGKYKELLQIYLYALIVYETQQKSGQLKLKNGDKIAINIDEQNSNLDIVIYPLKKLAKESIFSITMKQEELFEFKELLQGCVEEIFNPDIPFTPNSSIKGCKYCKLSSFCGV